MIKIFKEKNKYGIINNKLYGVYFNRLYGKPVLLYSSDNKKDVFNWAKNYYRNNMTFSKKSFLWIRNEIKDKELIFSDYLTVYESPNGRPTRIEKIIMSDNF